MHHRTFTFRLAAAATLLVASAVGLQARQLSPSEALQRAQTTLSSGKSAGQQAMRRLAASPMTCVYTEKARIDNSEQSVLYIFNSGNDGGWMIVSGDDRMVPVLGVSDSGSINPDDMPPAMKWWLGEYVSQLQQATGSATVQTWRNPANRTMTTMTIDPAAARNISKQGGGMFASNFSLAGNNGSAFSQVKAEQSGVRGATRNNINPLVKTKWDQGNPYNLLCPKDRTGKVSVTGCVATAMAQVVNYHKYPEKGSGTHSYTSKQCGTVSFDYGNTTFDWSNMADEYNSSSSQESKNAVATLMKACGVSVDMDYSSSASGAQTTIVKKALTTYFNYGPDSRYIPHVGISQQDWEDLVYEALAAGYPLIYNGQGTSGGHSFVCDGYSDGRFHINWGWSGYGPDGYYALTALDPADLGTGGGAGGFNTSQDIIIAVPQGKSFSPSKEFEIPKLHVDGYIKSGTNARPQIAGTGTYYPQIVFWNCTEDTLDDCYLYTEVLDSNLKRVEGRLLGGFGSIPPSNGKGINPYNILDSWTLGQDGTYYFCFKYADNADFDNTSLVVSETTGSYMTIIVEGGKISDFYIADPDLSPVESPEISFAEFSSNPDPVILDKPAEINFTLSNVSNADFSGEIVILFDYQGSYYSMCSGTISLGAHESGSWKSDLQFKSEKFEPGTYNVYLGLMTSESSFEFLDNKAYKIVLATDGSEVQQPLLTFGDFKATPDPIVLGEKASLSFSAGNAGNAAYSGELGLIFNQGNVNVEIPTGRTVEIKPGESVNLNIDDYNFSTTYFSAGEWYVYLAGRGADGKMEIAVDTPVSVGLKEAEKPAVLVVKTDREELKAGETATLTVSMNPESEFTYKLTTESKSVSIDGNKVTVTDRPELGEFTVVATADNGLTGEVKMTIVETAVETINLTADKTELNLEEGDIIDVNLCAEVLPMLATNPEVIWSCDYPGTTLEEQISDNRSAYCSYRVLHISEQAKTGDITVKAATADGVEATVVIKLSRTSGVRLSEAGDVYVKTNDGKVTVNGLSDGAVAELYDMSGRIVARGVSAGGTLTLTAIPGNIYLLRSNGATLRLRL